MSISYSGNSHRGNIYELHNLPQNLRPKIKFTMEHRFKELLLLDIHIKSENDLIITEPQTPNNTSTAIVISQKIPFLTPKQVDNAS